MKFGYKECVQKLVKGLLKYCFGPATLCFTLATMVAATQLDVVGPQGSNAFGRNVTLLSNGNFVVSDPFFGVGGTQQGAVYLYDGRSGLLISSLVGGTTGGIGDQLGSGGVYALPNGNYVVSSPNYSGGTGLEQVGAVSFCSGTSGCANVTPAGSMRGDVPGQQIGNAFPGVTVLSNGNFVVTSPNWFTSSGTSNSGAVTFCSGVSGCPGAISLINSLIGNRNDRAGGVGIIGSGGTLLNGVTPLSNGKYVVATSNWQIGTARVGAVTLCQTTGCAGTISAANSLTGSTNFDYVGGSFGLNKSVLDLGNGNYVVGSPGWTNPSGAGGAAASAGAATFCNDNTGCVGAVSSMNSLIGSSAGDNVGDLSSTVNGITRLTNGNYVVTPRLWDNGTITDTGAAVWCSGTSGCVGTISGSNALTGTSSFDYIGLGGATALTNGNYVIRRDFSNSGGNGGAAVFCQGTVGCRGSVSTNVALTAGPNDNLGVSIVALTNGNYVVSSPFWSGSGNANRGAVTLCSGTTGCGGTVTASNSLTGTQVNDRVGNGGANGGIGVTALTNGNYVVGSIYWSNGTTARVGATTFCSGTTGCTGPVSTTNSLIGTATDDNIGFSRALAGGGYVTGSTQWNNGPTAKVGAITFCSGTTGCIGTVSTTNSLYGSTANDQIGSGNKFIALPNGGYAFNNAFVDNGTIMDAGAVAYGKPDGSTIGILNTDNSVRGSIASSGGNYMPFDYDTFNQQIVVGRPLENKITLYRTTTRKTAYDFDGDGKSDLSIFRPADGNWWQNRSTSGLAVTKWGQTSDALAPEDYDGDGKTDLAIFRTDTWWILRSGGTSSVVKFGQSGDTPVPGDYDGDGIADLCVFRPSTGTWWRQLSSNSQVTATQFGANGDVPMRGDFDGDGKLDLAVFRPSASVWYVLRSSDGQTVTSQFGSLGDLPVNGDFNGDGKADLAVYRPSNGTWYIARPAGVPSQNFDATVFGTSTDRPVPADYDGDGKTDISIYRSGQWWVLRSSSGAATVEQFGLATDKPVPAAFTP